MMKSDIIGKILEFIVPISIISIIVLAIIVIIRIVFYMIIMFFSMIYLRNKESKKIKRLSPKTNIVIYKKEDEELMRDQEKEKKQEREQFNLYGVERMNQEFEEKMNTVNHADDIKVVGIAKPVGFWTSLVLGDQLSEMLGRAYALNNRSHKGFWVSMLEAQSRGLGRQHGKQRDLF